MAEGVFVTVINCMDGRTQLPAIEYLKKKYNADYVDTITEPGPIKFLAENIDSQIIESIKKRVMISIEKHGSRVIGLVGHFDCAGNPVNKDMQLGQLSFAARLIESWNLGIEVVKLWIDENWQVHEVNDDRPSSSN